MSIYIYCIATEIWSTGWSMLRWCLCGQSQPRTFAASQVFQSQLKSPRCDVQLLWLLWLHSRCGSVEGQDMDWPQCHSATGQCQPLEGHSSTWKEGGEGWDLTSREVNLQDVDLAEPVAIPQERDRDRDRRGETRRLGQGSVGWRETKSEQHLKLVCNDFLGNYIIIINF